MRVLSVCVALLVAHQVAALSFMNPARKPSQGQNWAVIVVGSDGWFNYRHQADAAHAYQLFIRNGFPEENIILLMTDDVANSDRNPRPGVLINRPGGPNVYKGVKVDYRGEDVTPEIFKKVLLGQATNTGSNKTLASGPRDNVFVNFVDHGGVGLVAFPRGAIVTSTELVSTLKTMHQKNMFNQLVFFMEACEGGSMFENLLPKNVNIYAHTAAGPDQSSYATYWDPLCRTFLGDAYSVAWMEDADQHFSMPNPAPETLYEQFRKVYRRIETQSQPHQYGDLSIGKRHLIDEFLAYRFFGLDVPLANGHISQSLAVPEDPLPLMVDARDSKAFALAKMLQENAPGQEGLLEELEAEYRLKQEAKDRFLNIAFLVDGPDAKNYMDERVSEVTDHQCLSEAISAFHQSCHVIDEHHIAFTRILARLCNAKHSAQEIVTAMAHNPLCLVASP